MNIDEDDYVSLLDDTGKQRDDVKLPEQDHLKDVASKIREIFEKGERECLITVQNCLDKDVIVRVKEGCEI